MTTGFEKSEDEKEDIVSKVKLEWERVEKGWIAFEYHDSTTNSEKLHLILQK